MTKSSSSYDTHMDHIISSQSACEALSTLLKSGILNDVEPLQMVSLLTTVSLLNDIDNITEKISESVQELASAARFKNKMKLTEPTVSLKKWILEAVVVPCQIILVMVTGADLEI
ncbi:hypothetical protein F2Q69_00060696 [Brassica cretica]|uniref:Uncharacterized protein n=1 Tax=Brassica cretica TaxID=69181 RepID=A0A8S9RFG8_BRACR|nr:hypothetical protein F2Q69_00060696 [Brassica cretica]